MDLLLSIAFILCWSSGFTGAKLGAGTASALTLLMWRFIPLAVILVAAAAARRAWRGLAPRDVARQAAVGLLSQSGYLLTVYYAIQLGVPSGTTALIDGVQPLVAGALAGPLLRQHVSGRQWLGLCLGLSGVVIVTGADAAASASVPWWAYPIPFLGMLCLVAATFLEGNSRTRVEPLAAMTTHCLTSAVVFTTLAIGTGAAAPPGGLLFWVAVTWLITLSTFGGYGLYWMILSRTGVTRVNTLMFLMAPVTAVWGALMFGEPLGLQTVLGLLTGLAAVAVVGRGSATSPARDGATRREGGHRESARNEVPGCPQADHHRTG